MSIPLPDRSGGAPAATCPAPLGASPGAAPAPRTALAYGLGLLLLGLVLGWRLAQSGAGQGASAELPALLRWWLDWPRLVAGVCVGACLGAAGALMQWITRNPLVSPDLLGVTAGAQLGVILGLVLPSSLSLPLVLVGGLAAALITFALAGGWASTPLRLTLAGVAVSQSIGALIALLLSLDGQAAMVVSLWNTGSLQQLGWQALGPAFWLLPLAVLVLALLLRPLGLAALGDAQMRALGMRPAVLKAVTVVLASLLAALAIHLAGPLGFVGLLVPNLLRLGFGVVLPVRLVPLSAIWGALLTLVVDALATLVAPVFVLPFGVLSALLGALTLLALLRWTRPAAFAPRAPAPPGAGGRRLPLPAFAGLAVVATLVVFLAGASAGVAGGPRGLVDAVRAGDSTVLALLELRLPRMAVDFLAGALFACSGLILQTVTRNPLAGPEILGVSQFAALAVLLGLVFAPELAAAGRLPLSWAGAGCALALVVGLNLRHALEPLRLTLSGFALAGLALAVTSLVIAHFTTNAAQALIWMVGSSYGATWADARALLPWLLAGLLASAAAARSMNLLQFGDEVARALGLAVARRRLLLVALAGMLVAAPVAVVGPVAFVGLLVPHAVRLFGYRRAGQRLVAAPLLGGLLLLGADVTARGLLAPLDVPLGITTAAIGAPCFLLLLARTWLRRQEV